MASVGLCNYVAVEFLEVSVLLLGEAWEHRRNVSVLPICLNKEKMVWGSLTGWQCSRTQ